MIGTVSSAPATPAVRAFGPGRVNLIGEHTDYNDGLCLPFAIDRGVTVEIREHGAPEAFAVHATDLGEEDAFALADPAPAQGWRAFARGMVAELQRDGHALRGGDVRFTGDVPLGAGLSSSAALEVALALALLAHAGLAEPNRHDLARTCSRVENDWVGARTGLLDQLAALYGRDGHALRLDMRSLEVEPVPLELAGWRLVTVGSGVEHAHAGSGYNERREEATRAAQALGVDSLRDAESAAAARLPDPLDRRVRHVLEENARVEETVAALRARDLAALGPLLDASHASLRDLYEVSVDEVERVVQRLKADGAAGARIMGGGFGGSVLALFPPGTDPPTGAGAVDVTPGPAGRLLSPSG
jgi:galactokinase